MANPVMNRIEAFSSKQAEQAQTPAGYPTMPGYQPNAPVDPYAQTAATQAGAGYYAQQQSAAGDPAQWQGQTYAAERPAAANGMAMTMDDVLVKTGIMFGVLLLSFIVSWTIGAQNQDLALRVVAIGGIAGFVLAMINIFKSTPTPALMLAYAAAEGVTLGALSMFMEFAYPGIVAQAVIGTMIVFAVSLIIFKTGLVQVNSRLTRIFVVGMISVIGFAIVSLLMQLFGVIDQPLYNQTIPGTSIPIGIIVGLIAIVLASVSLMLDFDTAKRAVEAGAPREYAWTCAFGLMVTLVWLYIEILRLLAILSDN